MELERSGVRIGIKKTCCSKEEGENKDDLMFLVWVDGGPIYEMERNKNQEPNIQFWTCGNVRCEMETVQ